MARRGGAAGAGAADANRPGARDLKPLAALAPFLRAHAGDAAAAVVSLLFSTGATLGLTAALRLVVDHGFGAASRQGLNQTFLLLLVVAVVLAAATACRFYFINRLGERIVADLRAALYRHVLVLDQAFFLKVRSSEVLSRLTADMTLV